MERCLKQPVTILQRLPPTYATTKTAKIIPRRQVEEQIILVVTSLPPKNCPRLNMISNLKRECLDAHVVKISVMDVDQNFMTFTVAQFAKNATPVPLDQ